MSEPAATSGWTPARVVGAIALFLVLQIVFRAILELAFGGIRNALANLLALVAIAPLVWRFSRRRAPPT